MTVYVIRYAAIAGDIDRDKLPAIREGEWLAAYDPEAHDGRGMAAWTEDPARALTFASWADAFNLWRMVPRCRPRRPDGKPNRPLTAYSVSIEKAER